MTDAPAAILATFSDLRLVKSRKTAQLVFEVPMERLKEALDALGMPDPQGDVWCGIALVPKSLGDAGGRNLDPAGQPVHSKRADGSAPSPTKPKKRWHEMPASQRAALLVRDVEFHEFLRIKIPMTWENHRISAIDHENSPETVADMTLKDHCGIASKAQLDDRMSIHFSTFERMEGNFHAWRQAKGHSAS